MEDEVVEDETPEPAAKTCAEDAETESDDEFVRKLEAQGGVGSTGPKKVDSAPAATWTYTHGPCIPADAGGEYLSDPCDDACEICEMAGRLLMCDRCTSPLLQLLRGTSG